MLKLVFDAHSRVVGRVSVRSVLPKMDQSFKIVTGVMEIETLSALEKVVHGPLLNCADGTISSGQLDSCTGILGLYFSASWCGPCKTFTPLLAQMYKNMQERLPGALEIIFVSRDKTIAQYNAYASTMPWKAIPYEDVITYADLSLEFGSRSIPHLVFCNNENFINRKKPV
jgi:thiol-disulfide isomerase/thioredoxin